MVVFRDVAVATCNRQEPGNNGEGTLGGGYAITRRRRRGRRWQRSTGELSTGRRWESRRRTPFPGLSRELTMALGFTGLAWVLLGSWVRRGRGEPFPGPHAQRAGQSAAIISPWRDWIAPQRPRTSSCSGDSHFNSGRVRQIRKSGALIQGLPNCWPKTDISVRGHHHSHSLNNLKIEGMKGSRARGLAMVTCCSIFPTLYPWSTRHCGWGSNRLVLVSSVLGPVPNLELSNTRRRALASDSDRPHTKMARQTQNAEWINHVAESRIPQTHLPVSPQRPV